MAWDFSKLSGVGASGGRGLELEIGGRKDQMGLNHLLSGAKTGFPEC